MSVKALLRIPIADNVDVHFQDGRKSEIKHNQDRNTTTISFETKASKDPVEEECTLQFIPKVKGPFKLTLDIDGVKCDSQSTLVKVD